MSGEQPGSESKQAGDSLSLRLERLNRQVAETMEAAVRSLAAEAEVEAEHKALGKLVERVAQLDRATDQSGVLMALLEGGRDFASRTAFFLTRSGEVRGWAGHGFGPATPSLEGLRFDYVEDSVWAELAEGKGAVRMSSDACARLAERIQAPAGEKGILVPFVLRGQLGGAFFADRLEGTGHLGSSSLLLLTHCAATALETLAFRTGSSPSLRFSDPGTEGEGVPIWEPSPEAVSAAAAAVGAAAVAAVTTGVRDEEREETRVEPSVEAVAVHEVTEAESAFAEPDAAEGDDASAGTAGVDLSVPPSEEETFGEELSSAGAEREEQSDFSESEEEDGNLEIPEVVTSPADDEADNALPDREGEGESFQEAREPWSGSFDSVEDEVSMGEIENSETAEEIAGPSAFEDSTSQGIEEPTFEELTGDLEPEPELEDTNIDLWASTDDEDDEDDEPTAVGSVVDSSLLSPENALQPPEDTIPEPEPGVSAELDPEAVGQQTVRLDLAALHRDGPGGAASAEVFQDPGDPGPPHVEPPVIEPPPFDPPEEEEISAEEQTMISQPRAEVFETSQGGYVPPPPEPKAEASGGGFGSTEVRPPEGLEGPGLAFAGGGVSQGDQEEWHEEARRLARLLVSEIKLYAEEQTIEEGRRNGDIYSRLKEDIDRSRQMYEERINPSLQGKEDYFYKELVQRLAGGDAGLLGM